MNPLAGLGACFVIAAAALVAVDPVTPTLLVAPVLALALARLGPRKVALRSLPVLLAAVSVGFSTALIAPEPGLAWGTGFAMLLRVLALALPGAMLAPEVDPTELADSLVQLLHLPARFAYGTLAALRLVPLLQDEWRMIGLARRARGVSAGRSPVAAGRLFLGRVFALLVGAVRRSARLAAAMDARGFDSGVSRSHARVVELRRVDALALAGAVALAIMATGTSIALGGWTPVWG